MGARLSRAMQPLLQDELAVLRDKHSAALQELKNAQAACAKAASESSAHAHVERSTEPSKRSPVSDEAQARLLLPESFLYIHTILTLRSQRDSCVKAYVKHHTTTLRMV